MPQTGRNTVRWTKHGMVNAKLPVLHVMLHDASYLSHRYPAFMDGVDVDGGGYLID